MTLDTFILDSIKIGGLLIGWAVLLSVAAVLLVYILVVVPAKWGNDLFIKFTLQVLVSRKFALGYTRLTQLCRQKSGRIRDLEELVTERHNFDLEVNERLVRARYLLTIGRAVDLEEAQEHLSAIAGPLNRVLHNQKVYPRDIEQLKQKKETEA